MSIRKINIDKNINNNTGCIVMSAACGTYTNPKTFALGYGNGNKLCGISEPAANNAPVLDLNGGSGGIDKATTYVNGSGMVTIGLAQASITDADNDQLVELTITVIGLTPVTESEAVQIGTTQYILDNVDKKGTAVYGSTTFTVKYFGSDKVFVITKDSGTKLMPLVDTRSLIRAIKYSSALLSTSSPDRQIEFVINDGRANSEVAALLIEYVVP